MYLTHFRLRSISGTCSLMASDWLWKVLLIFTFFVALWPEYPNFVQKIMSHFFPLNQWKLYYNSIKFSLECYILPLSTNKWLLLHRILLSNENKTEKSFSTKSCTVVWSDYKFYMQILFFFHPHLRIKSKTSAYMQMLYMVKL